MFIAVADRGLPKIRFRVLPLQHKFAYSMVFGCLVSRERVYSTFFSFFGFVTRIDLFFLGDEGREAIGSLGEGRRDWPGGGARSQNYRERAPGRAATASRR